MLEGTSKCWGSWKQQTNTVAFWRSAVYIRPLSCSAFMEPSGSFVTPETKQHRMEIKINWVQLPRFVVSKLSVYHFISSRGILNNHRAASLISPSQTQIRASSVERKRGKTSEPNLRGSACVCSDLTSTGRCPLAFM